MSRDRFQELYMRVRFYKEEEKGDSSFAEKLSKHGDVYVNDAFGTAHRAHASTTIVANYFSAENKMFGYLMANEVASAEKVLKITVLEAKVQKSETIGTEHLMLSILKNKDNVVTEILSRFDVEYESFKAELDFLQQEIKDELPNDSGEEEELVGGGDASRK